MLALGSIMKAPEKPEAQLVMAEMAMVIRVIRVSRYHVLRLVLCEAFLNCQLALRGCGTGHGLQRTIDDVQAVEYGHGLRRTIDDVHAVEGALVSGIIK